MKPKYIEAFMNIAKGFAILSSAKRLQVGAVVVKGDQILASGYNGMPAGWTNDCETKEYMLDAGGWLSFEEVVAMWPHIEVVDGVEVRYKLLTKPEVLHAESNVLSKIMRSTVSSEGADMFITHCPCLDCAKLMYQAGIKRVFYENDYHSTAGVDFLKKSGIEVIKLGERNAD